MFTLGDETKKYPSKLDWTRATGDFTIMADDKLLVDCKIDGAKSYLVQIRGKERTILPAEVIPTVRLFCNVCRRRKMLNDVMVIRGRTHCEFDASGHGGKP